MNYLFPRNIITILSIKFKYLTVRISRSINDELPRYVARKLKVTHLTEWNHFAVAGYVSLTELVT